MGFVEKASVLPGIGLFVMPFDKRVPANDRIPAWNLFWAAIGAGQDLDSERLLRVVEVVALTAALMFGVIASFVTSVSFEELWDVHERFATVPCNVADAVQGCDNDFYGMYGNTQDIIVAGTYIEEPYPQPVSIVRTFAYTCVWSIFLNVYALSATAAILLLSGSNVFEMRYGMRGWLTYGRWIILSSVLAVVAGVYLGSVAVYCLVILKFPDANVETGIDRKGGIFSDTANVALAAQYIIIIMGFALSQAQFVAVLNATVRGEVEEAKDKLKQESFRLKKEQEKQQGGAIAPEPAAPTDNKEVASKGGASGQ